MSLFLRNLLWVILLPGTVTGLVPFLLIKPYAAGVSVYWGPWPVAGLAVAVAGALILGWCVIDFARLGKGTLSVADPTKQLVVKGLYRYTRNPMYTGVIMVLAGESMVFSSLTTGVYALIMFVIFNLFVRLYEEPHLSKQFGSEYQDYCEQVHRWIPGADG